MFPDYVPLEDFWKDNGDNSNDYKTGTNWINANITCDGVKRLFSCWCARSVLHLYENDYPDDKRVRNSIEIAERFAFNEATMEELEKASNMAISAVYTSCFSYFSSAVDAASAAYFASAVSDFSAASAADAASVAHNAVADVRMNQNRALSLFKKPDNAPDDETLRLLCKFWYYDDRNLFFPIIDRLIELGLEDYRVRLMKEIPECYRLGMWPFVPEMILK